MRPPTGGAVALCDALRMTGASLQFHATNSEIVAMATAWAREFSLHAGLGTLFGDQTVAAENGNFGEALEVVPAPDFVILGLHPLRLPKGASLYRLKGMNSDIFVLQPGAELENDLAESVMVGIGDDPHAIKLWRRLVDRARRSMRSGAVITDPCRAHLARCPSHRFTDGALRLQESGVSMRGLAGSQLYRLTADPMPHPLQDHDMVALATISHALTQWIQAGLLPPELAEDLKEELARRKLVKRSDTVGDVAATIFDITCRLHNAFARDDRSFTPSPRATTYFLHFPTKEQAAAAASAATGRTIGASIEPDFPPSSDSGPPRHSPWRLRVTLPGVAPDPAHRQNEEDLIGLVREYDGAYAGWQRPAP